MLASSSSSSVAIPFDFWELFSPVLFLFCGMVCFFMLMFVINNFVSKPSKKEKLEKLLQELKWNAVIRFVLIFYLPLMYISIRAFKEADLSSSGDSTDKASFALGFLLFVILLFFTVFIFRIIIKFRKLRLPVFEEKSYNTLFYELKDEKVMCKTYYIGFVLHKFFFAVILAGVDDV